MTRFPFFAAFALTLALLTGCASTDRPLMPTPTLYQAPPAKALFEDLPPDLRRPEIELFYVTDREPDEDLESGLPYGEERARSLGFGRAVVDMDPALDWPELQRQSQLAERSVAINLEMGRIDELGRFPLEPYAMERTNAGVRRARSVIANWNKEHLPRVLNGRLTIYASPSDRALLASAILFRSRKRVGRLRPEDVPPEARDYFSKWGNIDLIVYEGKATDRFGHSYFSTNPEVSADLIQLIRYGRAPGEPGRPLVPMGAATWKFPN